jgi:Predicted EndoIII-related endonuclease
MAESFRDRKPSRRSKRGIRKPLAPSKRLLQRAAEVLPEVERRLRHVYGVVPEGHAPLGNKYNPLDELVYIQLSVRTRESAYRGTYPSIRRVVSGVWERLLSVPDDEALAALESGGMARVKLDRLRKQLAPLRDRFGRATLAPLRSMSTEDAEVLLRSLPGVGPKVARCVLLYSLDRQVFPVDSHCRRVLGRLGFLPPRVDIKASHDFLQALVPKHIRRSLHVNLIHHGRQLCTPAAPACEPCPLLSLCPSGTRIVRRRAARSSA